MNDCQQDYQIAYNVIISLWILSFHDYARKDFEDYDLMLVEKVLKILDFFNKEKVVRAVLLLLQSLSSSKKALEIVSDLSCIELIEKLQQRHWVDKDIRDMLDELWKILDENYQEFTSIGKYAKEVHNKALRWGPVHTTRFWQENYIHFNDKDNLDLIKILVSFLEYDPNDEKHSIT